MTAKDKIIYLDNNATTQLDPAVVEEMLPFLTTSYGNPSSGYKFGAEARKGVDCARERTAALLGCEPSEIVFTSCGTESNNAAINSALQFDPRGKHVVTSAVEHSSVLRHCQDMARRGCEVTFLGVDKDGNVDLAELDEIWNAIKKMTNERMTKGQPDASFHHLDFVIPSSFNICHLFCSSFSGESFQPAFVEFDQIKIGPNIFTAFAA